MLCNIPYPDLNQRLDHTVCMYNGQAVFVRTNDHIDSRVFLYRLDDIGCKIATIDSRDPRFDIATPPLGYCQVSRNQVAYITRLPFRRYKQGITMDVCNIQYINSNPEVGWDLYSEASANMIERRYPPVDMILIILSNTERYSEQAISNDCALVSKGDKIQVYFRMEEVGFISKEEVDNPIVYVPSSRKMWIVERYMKDFGFGVRDMSLRKDKK